MRDHSNRTGGNELGSKELTRGAGVLLAITSLPSSYGIGTLGEAAFQFVDLLVDLKQRYWQVLPSVLPVLETVRISPTPHLPETHISLIWMIW